MSAARFQSASVAAAAVLTRSASPHVPTGGRARERQTTEGMASQPGARKDEEGYGKDAVVLRFVHINDCYELENLPRLATAVREVGLGGIGRRAPTST